jgi:hypothetical protein
MFLFLAVDITVPLDGPFYQAQGIATVLGIVVIVFVLLSNAALLPP